MNQTGAPGEDEGDAAASGRAERAPRDSLFLQASAWFADPADCFPLRVRNLSSGGMMADCDRRCARGDAITIDLRGVGIVHGCVAWQAQGKIGVAFDCPVDPLLARRPVASPKTQTCMTGDLERARRPGVRSR